MDRYYLAYGSNLNVAQMGHRCPGATVVGVTKIPNYRLMFKGSKTGAYLTIENAEGEYVPVAVWRVSAGNERSLDIYEGYPSFYYKKPFVIEIDGKPLTAFAYIMTHGTAYGIPSDYYMRTCLDGYKEFGFQPDLLFEAKKRSCNLISRQVQKIRQVTNKK